VKKAAVEALRFNVPLASIRKQRQLRKILEVIERGRGTSKY
jgi:hypothetical protein